MKLLKILILNAVVTVSVSYTVVAYSTAGSKKHSCEAVKIRTAECSKNEKYPCLKILVDAQ